MSLFKNNKGYNRNVCQKKFLGVLSEAKGTMHAWHLCLCHPSQNFIGHTFLNHSRFVMLMVVGILISTSLIAQEIVVVQEPLRLSQDDAVERAIKSNLGLESARVSSDTKKRASELSWNQFIPEVTASGSMILDNKKTTGSGVAPVDISAMLGLQPGTLYGVYPYSYESPRLNFAATLQASLTLSMAMFENMNRLRVDYEGGLIAYEKAKLQLERDVRKAYNAMLLLQENINLLQQSYESVQRQVATARANYNAGLVPELTLLQAQVAMENMKPTMDQAEHGYQLSLAQFAMYLGLPYDTPFELLPMESETVFIPLDIQELISKAASGKPDIQELRHSILMLNSARKTQSLSRLPFLNLNWSNSSVFYRNPADDKWTGNHWNGSLTLTLGVRLNSLLPFSGDAQGMKDMDDQIRTANIGLAQMIQGTEIEIYNTVLTLERTQSSTEAQERTINLAERSYRLTEEAYRAGLQDFLQVQSAELELKQAKVTMLEQQFNYLNSLIDLEYAIGVPFGTLVPGNVTIKEIDNE